MGKVFLDMAVSLDGFVNGPNGEDGGLHDWYFSPLGDGQVILNELLQNVGAMILGKRTFGEQPDGFDTPYKVPHFVLSHEARTPIERDGAQFIFVADGIESALAQAKAAAGNKDVCVAGGVDTAQQCLQAGLLDEIQLHLVPVLFGGGLRLFESGIEKTQLERMRVLESPHATHLKFRVIK